MEHMLIRRKAPSGAAIGVLVVALLLLPCVLLAKAELASAARRSAPDYPLLMEQAIVDPAGVLAELERRVELEAAGAGRPERMVQLLRMSAYVNWRHEHLEAALSRYVDSLEWARRHGLVTDQAYALNALAGMYRSLRLNDSARWMMERVVELTEAAGAAAAAAATESAGAAGAEAAAEIRMIALANTGLLLLEAGEVDAARKQLAQSALLSSELQQETFLGSIEANLGRLELESGQLQEAREYLSRALALQREGGHPVRVVDAHLGLADVHLALQDWSSAQLHGQAAIDIAATILYPQAIRRALEVIGAAAAGAADYERAYQASVRLLEVRGRFEEQVRLLPLEETFADVQALLGKPVDAAAEAAEPRRAPLLPWWVLLLAGVIAGGIAGRLWWRQQGGMPKTSEASATSFAAASRSDEETGYLSWFRHDYRSLLNALNGMISLLQDTVEDPQQKRYLRTVAASSESLIQRFSEICDFLEAERGGLLWEEADVELGMVVEQLRQSVEPMLKRAGVEMEVAAPSGPLLVSGVDHRLLGYACGRMVEAVLGRMESGRLDLHVALDMSHSGNSELVIEVSGEQLFASVDRASLYLVDRIACLRGGRLVVTENEPRVTLRLELPVEPNG
jgi:tetratricopeptide (TPR) repeat protein